MGCESTASSPGGKRARDPEEEVYLDNFHSHKRYLSEIMASSLNGLTVGDSLTEHLMESPARDDVTFDYSPMSEDSDDSRFGDNPENGSTTPHPDIATRPTSPVSPHGHHLRLQTGSSSANMLPLASCSLPALVCSLPRQRASDTDGRFPSSPNDVCHTADLRRAALLRSVQIRTQGVERPLGCRKTLEDDVERETEDNLEDCSSLVEMNQSKLSEE
ncbi:hypothetical protein HPP92_016959 [Vanilla planifolia]|uniref:Uncharacterized protein n=1 Tax=Vanilla planifolia TaxID=51239 RepID=A0A835UNY4_VANPL|nr:hypothetical protein HPP92_016959 [Vanilla planifolia]